MNANNEVLVAGVKYNWSFNNKNELTIESADGRQQFHNIVNPDVFEKKTIDSTFVFVYILSKLAIA